MLWSFACDLECALAGLEEEEIIFPPARRRFLSSFFSWAENH